MSAIEQLLKLRFSLVCTSISTCCVGIPCDYSSMTMFLAYTSVRDLSSFTRMLRSFVGVMNLLIVYIGLHECKHEYISYSRHNFCSKYSWDVPLMSNKNNSNNYSLVCFVISY